MEKLGLICGSATRTDYEWPESDEEGRRSNCTAAELIDVLEEGQSGELDCLAECREHVDRVDQVLERETVLHRQDALVDYLRGEGRQDVDPEDTVALRLRHDLHEAAGVVDDPRLRNLLREARVARASAARAAGGVSIREPEGGYGRVCEHRVGDRAIVHREPTIRERVLRGDVSL